MQSHTDAPRLAKTFIYHSFASLEVLEIHFINGAVRFLYSVQWIMKN